MLFFFHFLFRKMFYLVLSFICWTLDYNLKPPTWHTFSLNVSSCRQPCRSSFSCLVFLGETLTGNDVDLSIDTLSSDVGVVIDALYGDSEPPPLILMGHR